MGCFGCILKFKTKPPVFRTLTLLNRNNTSCNFVCSAIFLTIFLTMSNYYSKYKKQKHKDMNYLQFTSVIIELVNQSLDVMNLFKE